MADIQETLITHLWGLLTTDNTLKTLMGGTVRLALTWAQPDCLFPYIVHRIDMANLNDWSPIRKCTYYLDIWSYSPNAGEALNIKERVMELLDNLVFVVDNTKSWMWIQTNGFIPESEQGINHYACQFNLNFIRNAQIGQILTR
ncbi:MAG: hypothetical protein Q8M94_15025 [Ignavibacteria bacterium]|nr:hypothetical protein [Ignavibacteria bacterium]